MIDFWLQYKEILIPIIFGLVFCIAGFYVNYKIEYLKKNGIKTKGYIVDYVGEYKYSSNELKYYYYPLVKFVDSNGKNRQVKLQTGTSFKPSKSLPSETIIFYIEENGELEVTTNSNLTEIMGVIFVIIGLSVIIVTLFLKFYN